MEESNVGEMEPLKPLSDREALQELINYIFGKDWYIVDPISQNQVNAIAVEEIKREFDILTNRKLKDKWNSLIDRLKFR